MAKVPLATFQNRGTLRQSAKNVAQTLSNLETEPFVPSWRLRGVLLLLLPSPLMTGFHWMATPCLLEVLRTRTKMTHLVWPAQSAEAEDKKPDATAAGAVPSLLDPRTRSAPTRAHSLCAVAIVLFPAARSDVPSS